MKFEAQALSNAFTYNPTLYENEWPLYRVGVLENVLDFAYTEDKVAEINMKPEIQSVQIPDPVLCKLVTEHGEPSQFRIQSPGRLLSSLPLVSIALI